MLALAWLTRIRWRMVGKVAAFLLALAASAGIAYALAFWASWW